MTKEIFSADEKILKKSPPDSDVPAHDLPDQQEASPMGITLLQQQVGNRAVQRLLAQCRDQPAEVGNETEARIEQERDEGQALDTAFQKQMSQKTGFDFSQVKVHTTPEADALSRELGAEAFTTGSDIFFRDGAYAPGSSGGQELLVHEMTHVVQQSAGMPGGDGSKMTVNAPDDAYEKKADAVAHQVAGSKGAIQTQEIPEEEEIQTRRAQRQEVPEEEEVQAKLVQRQEVSEEDELKKQIPDEEEMKKEELEKEKVPEEEEEQPSWKVK
jgi:hypothetical protein